MENNSAKLSLYIWVCSIWATPIIATLFASFSSAQYSWDVGLIFFFTLTSLPILALFVVGIGVFYKIFKKDWMLRLVIYLFSVLVGLPILISIIRLNELLIQNTIYFVIIEFLLITILVWTLNIKRGIFVRKQKLPPSRPDILDDDLR